MLLSLWFAQNIYICFIKTALKLHSHPLAPMRDPYSHGRWFCDQCQRTVTNVEEFSWHCDSCGYDECIECYTKSQPGFDFGNI